MEVKKAMNDISEREVYETVQRNSRWRGFIKSLFGGSGDTSKRFVPIGDGWSGEWDEPATYSKSSLTRMVKEIPDIRGAITTQVNAAVGEWKFVTVERGDAEAQNTQIIGIGKWAEYPERNFELSLRKMAFSTLMRGIYFLELSKEEGKEPWFYIMNPMRCKFKYNDTNTRIVGLIISNPTKPDAKPIKLKLDKFVYNSMDNFDGQDVPSPPLETLIYDSNIYAAAMAYIRNMYKSGGLGRMAFIMEEGSSDDYKTMKADVKSRKGSSVTIKGKIKIQPLSLSPKDMQYETIYDDFVEKVMTLYSVPPIMMSKPNASYKESSKSEMNAFASKIRALQRCLENGINQAILKLHGDLYADIRFKLKPWVDPATQAAIYEILMRIGVTNPNEVREELDKPKFKEEWADLPYNFNFPPQRMELEKAKAQMGTGEKTQEKTKQDGDEDKDAKVDKEKVKKFDSIAKDLAWYIDELLSEENAINRARSIKQKK